MGLYLSYWLRLAGILMLSFVLAACGSNEGQSPARQTSAPSTAQPDTSSDSDDADDNASEDTGDVAQGKQLFTQSVGGIPSCSTCHAVDSAQLVGPGMAGIGERAETRIEGQTAAEYLYVSIIDPGEYVVDGYQNVMPDVFEQNLSETEIHDLVAYLLSL